LVVYSQTHLAALAATSFGASVKMAGTEMGRRGTKTRHPKSGWPGACPARFQDLGPMLRFINFFRQKISKKFAFLTQNKAKC
jgi:hypothetical protein